LGIDPHSICSSLHLFSSIIQEGVRKVYDSFV
jgi:hypothetical protein